MSARSDDPRCSFCFRAKQEVSKMFAGPQAHVCDRCIATMVERLAAEDIAPQANTYCVTCGFEIRAEKSVRMLKGSVCADCVRGIAEQA